MNTFETFSVADAVSRLITAEVSRSAPNRIAFPHIPDAGLEGD